MKVTEVNYGLAALIREDIHEMRLKGANAILTVLERQGRLDITVDPVGERFYARIATHEVAVNDVQVRISVRGRELTTGEMAAEGIFYDPGRVPYRG